jgi:hypothetical protein
MICHGFSFREVESEKPRSGDLIPLCALPNERLLFDANLTFLNALPRGAMGDGHEEGWLHKPRGWEVIGRRE